MAVTGGSSLKSNKLQKKYNLRANTHPQQAALPEIRNPLLFGAIGLLPAVVFPIMPAYHTHAQAMNLQVGCPSLCSKEASIETMPGHPGTVPCAKGTAKAAKATQRFATLRMPVA